MTAVNCGVSAVAVHRRRRHLCHGALADSHYFEFLQLQYIDTVIDDCCAAPAVRGAGVEKTVEFPQLQR